MLIYKAEYFSNFKTDFERLYLKMDSYGENGLANLPISKYIVILV